MNSGLISLEIKNFRSLSDVRLKLASLNVLFGPNGSGKSTLLDTIWFVRDCAINGVDQASSYRDHGIGMLWDRADEGANTYIKIETKSTGYEISFGYSSGRIEPYVGERLFSEEHNTPLIDRTIGSGAAFFYHAKTQESFKLPLREPEKLSLSKYLDFDDSFNGPVELDKLLHQTRFYHSRSVNLNRLKSRGSDTSHHTFLFDNCQNLWSVLQNLLGRESIDDRYKTIMDFMKKAFPIFGGLAIALTSPTTVYGSFKENGRRQPIAASGGSDGHIQMLALLTALFSIGKERDALILFDEPEISLHPYALAVFAEAVELATREWNKQVLIATHSPVLISQFEPENILAVELGEQGQTVVTRVSDMEDIKDLLEQYAVGSLYMAEAIAAQSKSLAAQGGL
ncbi:MAG: AAA family ATPase [Deltaproteobacteria bacterium]|nr:AAA family ATPase [Deltaproteobacteria bacterium]